jgi:cytochrome c-type biogenesis protein
MSDLSLALAFVAGLLSFISPCVLALVPVYLAFLGESAAGVEGQARGQARGDVRGWQGPVIGQAALFVLGFSALFILLGISVGLLGGPLFGSERPLVRQVAGALVIALGVVTTGVFGPVLDRLSPIPPMQLLPAARTARAVSLGILVGIGWTPCIGAVLGTILTLGLSSQDVGVAALLLTAYSLGLAVPFLAAAVALPRVKPMLDWLRRHHRAVQVASGLFIIFTGVLIFTDAFTRMAGLFTFFI